MRIPLNRCTPVVFALLWFGLLSCEKNQVETQPIQNTEAGVTDGDLDARYKELEDLRSETESMLGILKEKEKMVDQRQARLDTLDNHLKDREAILEQNMTQMKWLRQVTYGLLMLAAALFIAALVLFLKKSKSSGTPAPVPEKKKIKPATVRKTGARTAEKTKTRPAGKKPAGAAVEQRRRTRAKTPDEKKQEQDKK